MPIGTKPCAEGALHPRFLTSAYSPTRLSSCNSLRDFGIGLSADSPSFRLFPPTLSVKSFDRTAVTNEGSAGMGGLVG